MLLSELGISADLNTGLGNSRTLQMGKKGDSGIKRFVFAFALVFLVLAVVGWVYG